jgi:hypothetical protein
MTSRRDLIKHSGADDRVNRASAEFQFGRASARFDVQMSPAGLLAVGLMVGSILLCVTPIVKAATRHLSRPDAK